MESSVKKYEPRNLKEVVGQEEAITGLRRYINNFKKIKKAALIYGPSGCGKTSCVYALANSFNFEIFEVNPSEFMTKDNVEKKLGNALKQRSLFFKGKIILIDELDALTKMDRGGLQAVTKLIEKISYPVIITMNDISNYKFRSLMRKCLMIEFKPLEAKVIFDFLRRVCEKEKIKYKESVLMELARRNYGDLRGALIDLEILCCGRKEVGSFDMLDYRERVRSMEDALRIIFKTRKMSIALSAFDNVRENDDEQFLWLEENIAREYSEAEDLAKAYDMLSKADVFRGRIRRWQYYRFLIYINTFLTAGIALAKEKKYKKISECKPTGKLLKLWWAKQKKKRKI